MSLTWPNLLSVLRLALIPVFIISLIDGHAGTALVIFGLAGITDLLDGFIARVYNQQSTLGAYLDPMADKLLLTAAYILLALEPANGAAVMTIPWQVSVLVITRDVVIVLVALVVYLALGISKFPPSRISKWNTAFQIIAVYMVLITRLWPVLTGAAFATIAVMVVLTTYSGLEYAYRFIYKANELDTVEAKEVAEQRFDAAVRPADGSADSVVAEAEKDDP